MTTNFIGLPKEGAAQLANELNDLLANYQILYMNVRGFHWNVTGSDFFELHAKFEEVYDQLLIKVDEIAERVLTLGHQPLHSFSEYLMHSTIEEAVDVRDGGQGVDHLLAGYQVLLTKQRRILSDAANFGDEGTAALMSDYVSQQEKESWMLAAYRSRSHN
ncbi:Dps family protein [Ferrimonas aestuarii]|uniref:DNA starvation/stationary phase protection protein n=1 Tax=Ferrimonas aestuarii TaxID=2569539 RepID=A0A4U1BLV4_9GAMM|nr:Dps family protein [Ferrimonas aestuarii]TKB51805.1 DNA starvation/stationary phase protection protein [Ferrimonas aestuarii]